MPHRSNEEDNIALSDAAGRRWGRRHTVMLLCFLALFIAYTDRVNISVAAVAMREQLGWTQTTKGFVLSSFFIGYMLFMIVSGWLANRYGGKRVLAVAVVTWSVFTLLTPWAAVHSIALLIAVRIGLGIGEAAVAPASFELFEKWLPASERTRGVAGFLSAIPWGQVVGFVGTGWIIGHWGWPMAFYVFGAIGVVWVAFWMPNVSDDPAKDARVSAAERALLSTDRQRSEQGLMAWRKFMTAPAAWAIFVTHFANNWALYLLISWLPSYFREQLGLSITNAGLFAAAPWLATFITANLAGFLADRAIARRVSVIRVRRITIGVELIGIAVFLMLARDVSSPTTALVLMCAATGCLGIGMAGFLPNILDIAPRHSAVLVGVSNTIATVPGIVGVAVTGWLIDATGTYASAFLLTAGVCIVGALFYFMFGRAEPLDVGEVVVDGQGPQPSSA